MLTTIALILVVLWALGFLGFNMLGGFIHILLVIAIILFLIRIIRGENPVK
jgi:asparagine N-glycosylation enzyme membrane subunit Stt3